MQPSNSQRDQARLNWLARIYDLYASGLQRSIYSKLGDLPLAEDLTSTVFLKALRWLRDDQSDESARGWLYATARTTIIDYWQAQGPFEQRSLSGLEDLFVGSQESPGVDQQQLMSRVQNLLSLLPERERSVLNLRYLQGYSAAEIADVLGTNAGHIRVLQLRALRRAAQLERTERNNAIMQEAESSFDAYVQLLTAESRKVFDLAHTEMLTLKHNFIGTEHLLWGLVSEGSLTPFFAPQDLTPERIHTGMVFIYDRRQFSQAISGEIPTETSPLKLLTPRARQTIVLAGEEMKGQGEQTIRPSHLLLGLMNEGEGLGAGLLRLLGVTLIQARAALTPPTSRQVCTFCGRTASRVKRLFPAETGASSGTPGAYICDLCVTRFYTMLGLVEEK